MALVPGCVWEHVSVYVQGVQVVQGAQVPVRGIVGLHVLMPALLGVGRWQAPVVAVVVQAIAKVIVRMAVPAVPVARLVVAVAAQLHAQGHVPAVPEAVT